MCGRVLQTLPLSRLIAITRARLTSNAGAHTSSYNVCPTTFIPAIRSNKRFVVADEIKKDEEQKPQGQQPQKAGTLLPSAEHARDTQTTSQTGEGANKDYELGFLAWGLKTKYNMIINARCEQLLLNRTFTKIVHNRCVIIIEGYFQWKNKEPYLFKDKTSDHLLVAGLYNQDNQVVILTREAASGIKDIHHRMPVILTEKQMEDWLNPESTKHIGQIIEKSFMAQDKPIWENLTLTKLAPYVSSVKQKSSKCIMSFQDYKKQLDKTGIMRFFKKIPVQTVDKDGQTVVLKSSVQNVSSQPEVDAILSPSLSQGATDSKPDRKVELLNNPPAFPGTSP